MAEYVCKTCHIKFPPKRPDSREGRHSFCSRACKYGFNKKTILKRLCKRCNGELLNRRSYYHDECRLITKRQKTKLYSSQKKLLVERKCKECGISFVPEYTNKRRSFCSAKCLKRYNRNMRKGKKIAQRFGVDYEYIDPIKVFQRDNWLCKICNKPTPRNMRGSTNANAPEVDHIIPISKRGAHVYTNVQCTCRECNAKKSNKIPYGVVGVQSLQF